MDIEHFIFLSWFSRQCPTAMSKTARGCAGVAECELQQRPAILPWRSKPCLAQKAQGPFPAFCNFPAAHSPPDKARSILLRFENARAQMTARAAVQI
jgi:hypothetical protein